MEQLHQAHNHPEKDCYQEQLLEEPITSDDVQATNEVESSNFNLEELESRLAPGQIVEDEHITFALYCKYAHMKGFKVRKGKNVKFTDGSGLSGKFFYCSCQGVKDEKRSINQIPHNQRRTFRCNCEAKLQVSRRKNDVWRVAKFHKEHNHEMYLPDETYMLRSNRKLTDEEEMFLTAMVQSKIPLAKAIRFLERSAHGRENIGFIPKDAYDCVNRVKRRSKIDIGDAPGLIQYFINKSNTESGFYWNVEVDDDGTLMNFFCRDNRCLKDYEYFGDVVSVDTTYNTNKYGLMCAPLVGINHHHENIMFGIAFLSDEKENTFEWLFRTFLKSMGGKQPETVFTDQCQAMMNAVGTVFPSAQHRLCQWHINENAPSHFGILNNDKKFLYLWGKCMNFCDYGEEFEGTWAMMIKTYGIDQIHWFNIMYKLRNKWATVFSKSIFSDGLLATSRSEGTNFALKNEIGNRTSSLLDCINGYEAVQDNWRLKEKENDIVCHHNNPTPFVRTNPLLKQVANLYTFSIFKWFENEFKDIMCLETPQPFAFDGSLIRYRVKAYGSSRLCTVDFDSQKLEIKCSCNFETTGVLCRHALKVFDALNVQFVPEKYIKKRWTKGAKSEICFEKNGDNGCIRGSRRNNTYLCEMAFVNHAIKDVREVAMLGKADVETRNIVKKHIDDAKEEVKTWLKSKNFTESTCNFPNEKENTFLEKIIVRDPPLGKGVTNIKKRHWDEKGRKGKAKVDISKKIVSTQVSVRNAKVVVGGRPPLVVNIEPSLYTGPYPSMNPMVHDAGGNFNSPMNMYTSYWDANHFMEHSGNGP